MQVLLNQTIEKPWGKEIVIALTEDYCFKRIEINANHKTSLQLHEQKEETICMISGSAIFRYERDNEILEQQIEAGFFAHIPPLTIHGITAITDVVLMEASSPQIDDVVRLSDDYGREKTG